MQITMSSVIALLLILSTLICVDLYFRMGKDIIYLRDLKDGTPFGARIDKYTFAHFLIWMYISVFFGLTTAIVINLLHEISDIFKSDKPHKVYDHDSIPVKMYKFVYNEAFTSEKKFDIIDFAVALLGALIPWIISTFDKSPKLF